MRLAVDLDSAVIEFHEPRDDEDYPWLEEIGGLRIVARAGSPSGSIVGETPSCTVALNNANRQAAAILSTPIRRAATIFDNAGDVYFEGTIATVRTGRTLVLTIEA